MELLKDKYFGGKKTKTLQIKINNYILSLFNNTRKNIWKSEKTYNCFNYTWYIFLDSKTGNVWGVSGDYWFGHAPSYFKNKCGGNIDSAKEVFEQFLKDIKKEK